MSVRDLAGAPIRFSQLLRMRVIDAEGEQVGQVHDARFIKDGPVQGAFGPGYRMQGLIVGGGTLGIRLGFDRASVKGPWILKSIFRRLQSEARFVDWSVIDAIEQERITLKVPAGDLKPVDALPG